jgi:hypothetical protein
VSVPARIIAPNAPSTCFADSLPQIARSGLSRCEKHVRNWIDIFEVTNGHGNSGFG